MHPCVVCDVRSYSMMYMSCSFDVFFFSFVQPISASEEMYKALKVTESSE